MSAAGKKRGREGDVAPSVSTSSSGVSAASLATAMSPTSSMRDAVVRALEAKSDGLTQKQLENALGRSGEELLPALNSLLGDHRVELLNISRPGKPNVLMYKIVAVELAARLTGLSAEDRGVLALIEKSGNQGIWVRNIKLATRLQQMQINKTLKRLANRKLIKAVKSVAFRNRKMYMSYDLEPAKEVTGGVWYTEQQLDQDFVAIVRRSVHKFLIDMGGKGTPVQVAERLKASGVSHTPLSPSEIAQVMDTLVYDGLLDYQDAGSKRLKTLLRPQRAIFPSPENLQSDDGPGGRKKKAGARGGSSGAGEDDDLDGSDDDDEDDDDDETEKRVYHVLPHALGASATLGYAAASASAAGGSNGAAGASSSAAGASASGAAAGSGGGMSGLQSVVLAPTTRAPVNEAISAVSRATHMDTLTAIPCGTCPVAKHCKPGGVVSPETCVYYATWLMF